MGIDFTTLDPRRRTGDPFGGTVIFNRLTPAIDPCTERARLIWSAGDYDRISTGLRHDPRAFVERLALTPEQNVLDAACGSGNLTIPAARTGAWVTGFDLVSPLLDDAAKWAAREGLEVRLDQGTVEEMPYAEGEFDVVLSMFGVMFAPRPDRKGFIGRLLATHVAYVPAPAGFSSPLLWGDESVIKGAIRRARLGCHGNGADADVPLPEHAGRHCRPFPHFLWADRAHIRGARDGPLRIARSRSH
jgi:SAM-dependent methyltransferase